MLLFMAKQSKMSFMQRRWHNDLLAVDFDPDATRCVRFKRTGANLSVVAAQTLPSVDLSEEACKNIESVQPLNLPKDLQAKAVAIALPASEAVVKLLSLPGQTGDDIKDKVMEHMGIEGDGYRIRHLKVSAQSVRETKLLAVAVPEAIAVAATRLFPSGNPVPISLEISGVAALTAFDAGPIRGHVNDAIGVIELGARASFVSFFNKTELALVRKFDFGLWNILNRIQQELALDRETVAGLMADNAFDVSNVVKEASESFIKQMIISRHFVERRENCRITRMYVPGGPLISGDWINEVKSAMGFDVEFWDPFAVSALKMPPTGLGADLDAHRSMFAAVVGLGLGILT